MFSLLGARFAMEDKKRQPFRQRFTTLGVKVDLTGVESEGDFVIANKDGRVQEVDQLVADVLAQGSISSSQASTLCGTIRYAEGQTLGRVAAPYLRLIERAVAGAGRLLLDTKLRAALQRLPRHVRHAG